MPSFSKRLTFLLVLCALALPGAGQAATQTATYGLEAAFALPGPVKWDYLTFDQQGHRLFITRGDRVDVMDVDSHNIIGSIGNLRGVHGVALVPALNKGFITEGNADQVTVIDLKTLQPISAIPTGRKPDAVIYDPSSAKIIVTDGASEELTIIDPKTAKTVGTVKLSGTPEFPAIGGDGRLYVNLEDKARLAVVDLEQLKEISSYNLAPACEGPTGLAVDPKTNRLFATCANKTLVVVQGETGAIIDTLVIGEHPDAAAFDPATGFIFSSNGGDGTLTVIAPQGPDHYETVQNAHTAISARTMAIDTANHLIYLSSGEADGYADNAKGEPRLRVKPDSFRILIMGPVG